MDDSSTTAVATRFLGNLLGHDWDAAMSQLAVDAEIVVTGRNALAGRFTGPAHFRQILEWMFREHDAGIDVVRCEELLTANQTAVALVEERAHRDTRSLRYRRVIVMVVQGAQITELRIIAEDPYALDAFWE